MRQITRTGWRFICASIFGVLLFCVWLAPIFPGSVFLREAPLIFALVQLALLIPIFFAGRDFILAGCQELAARKPGLHALLTLGVFAAVLHSLVSTIFIAAGDSYAANYLYFAVAGIVLALALAGEFLQERARKQIADACGKILSGFVGGRIARGDSVIIRPGERIPVDGVVRQGGSAVDEALLSGSGMPMNRLAGDIAYAGTLNRSAELCVHAEGPWEESLWARCARLARESASRRVFTRVEDTLSGYAVLIIAALSVLAGLGFLIGGGGFHLTLRVFMSVLIVACPCAVWLSGASAMTTGIRTGEEKGILIKTAAAMEAANKVNVIVLDKTGTLTKGRPSVTDILPLSGDESVLLTLAASAASASQHPVLRAIVARARDERLVPLQADRSVSLSVRGASANINGNIYHIGGRALLDKLGIPPQGALSAQAGRLESEGKLPIFLTENGQPLGIIALADEVKETTGLALKQLLGSGLDVVMVTGDGNDAATKAVALAVGIIEVITNAAADDKLRQVQQLQEAGKRVLMIGDGVSDAPAIARADIGIAIGENAADPAKESADILLPGGQLTDLCEALRLSADTARTARQNLFIALGYGAVCAAIAVGALRVFGGPLLTPGIALASIILCAGTVMLNAKRLAER